MRRALYSQKPSSLIVLETLCTAISRLDFSQRASRLMMFFLCLNIEVCGVLKDKLSGPATLQFYFFLPKQESIECVPEETTQTRLPDRNRKPIGVSHRRFLAAVGCVGIASDKTHCKLYACRSHGIIPTIQQALLGTLHMLVWRCMVCRYRSDW